MAHLVLCRHVLPQSSVWRLPDCGSHHRRIVAYFFTGLLADRVLTTSQSADHLFRSRRVRGFLKTRTPFFLYGGMRHIDYLFILPGPKGGFYGHVTRTPTHHLPKNRPGSLSPLAIIFAIDGN